MRMRIFFDIRALSVLLVVLFSWLFQQQAAAIQYLYFEKIDGTINTPNTPIHGIAKDSLGYIWFGSWSGLYRYNGHDFERYQNEPSDRHSLPANRIRNVVTDQQKQLWLLTFDNRYVRYRYATDDFEVVAVEEVDETVAYLLGASSNAVNRNHLVDGVRYRLGQNRFGGLHVDSGIAFTYRTDPARPGSLSDDYITSFYIDDQEVIWLGSRKGYVFKANPNRNPFELSRYLVDDDGHVINASVRAVLARETELWVGTSHNGIVIFKNGELQEKHPFHRSGFSEKHVRCFLHDRKDRVWIGTTSGLYCYDPQSGHTSEWLSLSLDPDLAIPSVFRLIESSDGSIWIGLYNALGFIGKDSDSIQIYYLEELVGDHSIMDLCEGPEGRLWLGTEGNGLVSLRPDGQDGFKDTLLLNSDSEPALAGNLVYSLYNDGDKSLWVGTSEGLSRLDTENIQIVNYSDAQGLPDTYISGILGAGEGNVWLSHKKGLTRLKVDGPEMHHFRFREHDEYWVFLDGAYGKDPASGRFYFGARNGLVGFLPDSIRPSSHKPSLVMAGLQIGGRSISPGDTLDGEVILDQVLCNTDRLQLKHKHSTFSIEMHGLFFPGSEDLRYEYFLDGYDEDWIRTPSNSALYTRLPAGQYRFSARVFSSEGGYSPELSLSIRVLPPWYASGAAFFMYAVLLTALVLLITYLRTAKQRFEHDARVERLKSEKEKEVSREKIEFFTYVSHEFRTPLTLITDPLRQLIAGRNIDRAKSKLYLSIIERNVRELTVLINQLLDFRRAESGKLKVNLSEGDAQVVLDEVFSFFEEEAHRRNISYRKDGIDISRRGVFDFEKLRQILTNLLSNAFKYTFDGGEIVLRIEESEVGVLLFQVTDSGVGMGEEDLERVFEPFNQVGTEPVSGRSSGVGLALTQKIVELLKGRIMVKSTPGVGTVVSVYLPYQVQPAGQEATVQFDGSERSFSDDTGPESDKPVLLLVEDNRDVCAYLQEELQEEYSVLVAFDGLDGYKTAVDQIPDAIISDVMMPKMNGYKMCNKIKESEATAHIPIVLLSARSEDADRVEGLGLGADVYMPKPFNVGVLKAQINSLLKNRDRLQSFMSEQRFLTEIKSKAGEVNSQFIKKVVAVIEANLAREGFNTEALAEELNLSLRQLYRKMKAVSGSTPFEFITKVRMEKASHMLLEDNMNVSEVAFQVGFSEPSNFSRTFSRHFGCSPTAFVRKHL